jgi:hypothetical protein
LTVGETGEVTTAESTISGDAADNAVHVTDATVPTQIAHGTFMD